jgi:nucleoside permease NupC
MNVEGKEFSKISVILGVIIFIIGFIAMCYILKCVIGGFFDWMNPANYNIDSSSMTTYWNK